MPGGRRYRCLECAEKKAVSKGRVMLSESRGGRRIEMRKIGASFFFFFFVEEKLDLDLCFTEHKNFLRVGASNFKREKKDGERERRRDDSRQPPHPYPPARVAAAAVGVLIFFFQEKEKRKEVSFFSF